MPLSRLENFLKNVQGNVIYVNPEELDATDDVSNTVIPELVRSKQYKEH